MLVGAICNSKTVNNGSPLPLYGLGVLWSGTNSGIPGATEVIKFLRSKVSGY